MPEFPTREFWNLDILGYPFTHPPDEEWSWQMGWRLRKGRPLEPGEWPDVHPVYTTDWAASRKGGAKSERFEDGLRKHGIHFFSDRLRSVIERFAPGACEFLPVHFEGPGAAEAGPYWAVNWVRVFDCRDHAASEEAGQGLVQIPVIDPSRVPKDGVLGLLGGYTVVRLVRNDLKLVLQRAGFTGVTFGAIGHTSDPVPHHPWPTAGRPGPPPIGHGSPLRPRKKRGKTSGG